MRQVWIPRAGPPEVMELREARREPETGRATWVGKAALAIAVALAGVAAGFLPLLRRIPLDLPGPADILAAARISRGLERMDQIRYAVLESTGGISIVPEEGASAARHAPSASTAGP